MNSVDKVSIAYLGPLGSFTYEVAEVFRRQITDFAPWQNADQIELVSQKYISDVFKLVDSDYTNFGVVPIENNVEGAVGETLDLLLKYDNLRIVTMHWLPIQFDVVKLRDDTTEVSIVKAHSHAIAQCRNYIEHNKLEEHAQLSNSAAALSLQIGEVALVPHNSLAFPRLIVVDKCVQDYSAGATQFVLLTHLAIESANEITQIANSEDSNHNLWAITPQVADQPGTLVNILQLINQAQVNISSLMSRPVKSKKNQYTFFLTLDASYSVTNEIITKISKIHLVQHLGWWK